MSKFCQKASRAYIFGIFNQNVHMNTVNGFKINFLQGKKLTSAISRKIQVTPIRPRGTVRRKSIRPFADFSSKMAIFKGSELYLNNQKFIKFTSRAAFSNGESYLVWFLIKNFHCLRFYEVSKLKMQKKQHFIK